jgi:hypothetical protein
MTAEDTSGPVGSQSQEDQATTLTGAGQLSAGRPQETLPSSQELLKGYPSRSDAEMAMDYRALRAVIGGIAVLLVFVVYILNWVIFTHRVGACFWPNPRIPDSLSGYYYTHMRGLFVGAMCAMGVFFIAYRGLDRWDSWFTNVAGLAAICIALSPTNLPSYTTRPNGPNLFLSPKNPCGPVTLVTYHQSSIQQVFSYVHAGSLVALFLMVFLMVLFQFTRTANPSGEDAGDPAGGLRAWWNSLFSRGFRAWWKSLFPIDRRKRKKKLRNKIYVGCAGVIAISGLLALATAVRPSIGNVQPWLLYAEIGAFVSFGIAWFVKGAASTPPDRPQPLVRALSRTAGLLRLADETEYPGQPAAGSEPAIHSPTVNPPVHDSDNTS